MSHLYEVIDSRYCYKLGEAETLTEAMKIGQEWAIEDYIVYDRNGKAVFDSETDDGYTIRCTCHTYITLEWNGQFIACYDNDSEYMEHIVEAIEKRTGMRFNEITLRGCDRRDFNGLRYLNGGFKTAEQIFA